jgi:hypothetical protein
MAVLAKTDPSNRATCTTRKNNQSHGDENCACLGKLYASASIITTILAFASLCQGREGQAAVVVLLSLSIVTILSMVLVRVRHHPTSRP